MISERQPGAAAMIRIIFVLALLGLTIQTARAQTPEADKASLPEFFIEAEVNNLMPFFGQQIIYVVNRYQATAFPNYPYYENHPFTGFWSTPLIQRPSYTTTINGREYQVHQTHMALFPSKPGPVTIEPTQLVIPGDRPGDQVILTSDPIDLQIRPLPDNSPPTFQGAVGHFEIRAQLSDLEGRVNQPLTLILEIKGAGNIETLIEPALPDLPDWRLLTSEMTTNVLLAREVVEGSRKFIWTLVPGRVGEQQIPPVEFSYFNPQTGIYQTIRTNPISVRIQPDPTDLSANTLPPLKREVRRLGGDIRHIKAVPATLSTAHAWSESSLLFYIGCLILPLMAIWGVWGWQQRRRYWQADTSQARRRRAYRQARKLLVTAEQPQADQFAIMRQALTGYLSDKLGQPVSGLTSDRLVGSLRDAGLGPKLVEEVVSLLEQIEAGRFGPAEARQTASQRLLTSIYQLIESLEKSF